MEETKKEESDPPPDTGLHDGLVQEQPHMSQDWNMNGPVSASFSAYVRTTSSDGYGSEGSKWEYRHLVPPNEDDDPEHWDALLASYRGEMKPFLMDRGWRF